jgi:hypothetical protein
LCLDVLLLLFQDLLHLLLKVVLLHKQVLLDLTQCLHMGLLPLKLERLLEVVLEVVKFAFKKR